MLPAQALENYYSLVKKIEKKFLEIRSRNPHSFSCGKGCSSCCVSGLTISPMEREAIAVFLNKHPNVLSELPQARAGSCAFLLSTGDCAIYEARPLVCRSQGAPLLLSRESREYTRSVCSLNFLDSPILNLPANDFINTETVQAILASINILYFGKDKAQQRTPLTPDQFS